MDHGQLLVVAALLLAALLLMVAGVAVSRLPRHLLPVVVLALGMALVAAPAHAAKPYRQGLVATEDANGTNPVVDHVIIHSNWRDLESADQVWSPRAGTVSPTCSRTTPR